MVLDHFHILLTTMPSTVVLLSPRTVNNELALRQSKLCSRRPRIYIAPLTIGCQLLSWHSYIPS